MDVVTARWKLITDSARCRRCLLPRDECDKQALDVMAAEGVPLNCCPDCTHPVSQYDVEKLLAETAAGDVRPVEEVNPPPVQGPLPVSFHWLLHQGEWWQPKRGPMIKISSMTDTHRLHTVRMLQRQAVNIGWFEHQRQSMWLDHPLGPSGDAARDAFDRELDEMLDEPITWLMRCALLKALAATLPKPRKLKQWARLEERATHWSDCPASRNLNDPCQCRVENPDNPEVGPPLDRALFDEASGKGIL
jgi:hypothetical protein